MLPAVDLEIKSALEQIINSTLTEKQWTIASLPTRYGGLGIRKLEDVALPAFLSSANSVIDLVNMILLFDTDESIITGYSDALLSWLPLNNEEQPITKKIQRSWDQIVINRRILSLSLTSDHEKARVNASRLPESSAWLTVLPSRNIGTMLDNNTFRISVALRLGCDICLPHQCKCGVQVNQDGIHGLSCISSSGRLPCHSEFNNIICRSLNTANIPSVLEPPGLSRHDGKRVDGLTLIPWSNGKMLIWDATISDTLAPSYVHMSSLEGRKLAEQRAKIKRNHYKDVINNNYLFLPFACETLGPWCVEAIKFIEDLGSKIAMTTGEPRSTQYLKQRISIALQRTNAASVMGTFDRKNRQTMEEIFYIL